MKTEPLFAADSFGKSFGSREVLKAATVWAVPGRVTVLFGRNGSGKSTLLRAAMGLLRPDFGVVRYDGEAYLRPRLHKLARRGLMYFPDRGLLSRRRNLAWHHRVLRLQMSRSRLSEAEAGVAVEGLGAGAPVKEPEAGVAVEELGAGARVEELGAGARVKELGAGAPVEDLLSKLPDEMSGGEARRAEMSLVLARKPRCLIADEPLAKIAPKDKEVVSGAIRKLADEGCAVLVTGHDVEALLSLADEVVWMVGGTTHWLGSPDSARNHFQFRQDYLGPRG